MSDKIAEFAERGMKIVDTFIEGSKIISSNFNSALEELQKETTNEVGEANSELVATRVLAYLAIRARELN